MNRANQWRVGVITDAAHPDLCSDDAPLEDAFIARGAEIRMVPWGAPRAECEGFDLFVVRTPWDYFGDVDAFLGWIDGLPARVVNPPDVLRWNSDKRYLMEIEERGIARIPKTVFLGSDDRRARADGLLDALQAERAVVKPAVSGGAFRTRVIARGDSIHWSPDDVGGYLVQAFVPEVVTRGEWSLVYFDGAYSHAVRKCAAEGDFRVQDDFGGTVHFDEPPLEVLEAGRRIEAAAPRCAATTRALPYARVDLVETELGPLLMELELIEPELFFRAEPAAPDRFVAAALGGS